MRRPRFLLILCVLLTVVVAWRAQGFAQSIKLSNLVVDNKEGRITARFGVEVAATQEVEQALRSGQLLALQCRATLSRRRDYFWNAGVAQAQTVSRLILSGDGEAYEVIHPGGRRENYRGRDLGVVMREAWGTMDLDLGPWDSLSRGNVYVLSLEVRLLRQDVSAWLKNTLFFWNFDTIPPAEYKLEFSY